MSNNLIRFSEVYSVENSVAVEDIDNFSVVDLNNNLEKNDLDVGNKFTMKTEEIKHALIGGSEKVSSSSSTSLNSSSSSSLNSSSSISQSSSAIPDSSLNLHFTGGSSEVNSFVKTSDHQYFARNDSHTPTIDSESMITYQRTLTPKKASKKQNGGKKKASKKKASKKKTSKKKASKKKASKKKASKKKRRIRRVIVY